jgi:galactonate dehydratase
MTRRLAPLRPFWIEEPLAVDRLDAYRRLKSETGAPIASGEHRHTRWEHKPFFDAGVLDIAQFDVLWVGGISESVKLCTLASAYDLRVMPHGGCMHATLHVIAAIPEWRCPLVSYVPQLIEKDQAFLARKLRCEGGFMDLPPGPGLGLELDERVVRARRRVSFIPESGAR